MNPARTAAVIPARLESKRLPGKLLLDLCGKPLIQRVYENVRNFNLFESIFVATDSPEIQEACEAFGCPVITTGKHPSGTSRIAEAAETISSDIIVNIQGDEPFLKKQQVQNLIEGLNRETSAEIATLILPCHDPKQAMDPNIVKVIRNEKNFALYFSRFPVPFDRDPEPIPRKWLLHLGIYAYKKSFLVRFPDLKPSEIEEREKLEQLRFLTNDCPILLIETEEKTIGIDTLSDLQEARKFFLKPFPEKKSC